MDGRVFGGRRSIMENTPLDWVTGFTTAGPGGETPQSYNATVGAQIGTSSDPHAQKLRDNPSHGGVIYHHNLANQTDGGSTVQNTANCYVVSAPGYYCFPLVYGNAIKMVRPTLLHIPPIKQEVIF